MPRIERFFAGSKVEDWMSDSVGASAGGGLQIVGGESITYTDPGPEGGTIWVSHTFLASGQFTVVSGEVDCQVMVCAGGGGSGTQGNFNDSGGAAGGMRVITGKTVNTSGGPGGDGVYPVTIGAGGLGYSPGVPGTLPGSPSGWAHPVAVNATGGGGGGKYHFPGYAHPAYPSGQAAHGGSGGSGGGAGTPGGNAGTGNAGGYSPVEGYAGGSVSPNAETSTGSGSGGGAGGAGASPSPYPITPGGTTGANGGAAVANVYRYGPGTPVSYCGGCAGSVNPSYSSTQGSPGGGGAGNNVPTPPSTPPHGPLTHPRTDNTYNGNADHNSGSAGGSGGNPSGPHAGGSGIVVIRYPIS